MALLALLGCQPDEPPPPTTKPAPPARKGTPPKAKDVQKKLLGQPKARHTRPKAPQNTYAGLLAKLNDEVATHRKRVEKQRNWPRLEVLAQVHMRRARLTGDWDDYEAADKALEGAFELARAGEGPFMTRARLNFTLHRFELVDGDLDTFSEHPLLKNGQKSSIAQMRADLASYRGQTDKAKAGYEEALALDPRSVQAHARQAIFLARQGDYQSAEAGLDKAAGFVGKNDHLGASRVHLQKGILDLERNRLDEAMAHYKDADAALQGWWLIEEHMAEVHALKGEHDKAQTMYRDLIIRTQSPEFMSALARSLRTTGKVEEAETWVKKAKASHEARLKRFPEATRGHERDHRNP